jgi:hypothetical protein
MLRRLIDEPFAVADRHRRHLDECRRCQTRRASVGANAAEAHQAIARPQAVPDLDRAWARFGRDRREERPLARPRLEARRSWRFMGVTAGSGAAVAGVGVLVAGAAAATTLTTVFAPTHVKPVAIRAADLRAFASVLGLEGATGPGGPGASGPPSTGRFRYGTIASNLGALQQLGSLGAAEQATGLPVTLPGTLPAGVTGPPVFFVEKAGSATVRFGAAAGKALDGSTLHVSFGPVVAAVYPSTSSGSDLPALAIVAMERPTATSNGASLAEMERYLLTRPGFPQDLARQLRLLSSVGTALPIPTPPGSVETSLTVAGSPAVMLSEGGGIASAVVWEDHGGIVHTVAGLLDTADVLGVTRQIS